MYRLWRWNERTCKYCNFGGVCVAHLFYFLFLFLFCLSSFCVLCDQHCRCFWIFQCVLPLRFSLTFILLSVLLRFTDSDYPFGIFKLFLYFSAHKIVIKNNMVYHHRHAHYRFFNFLYSPFTVWFKKDICKENNIWRFLAFIINIPITR